MTSRRSVLLAPLIVIGCSGRAQTVKTLPSSPIAHPNASFPPTLLELRQYRTAPGQRDTLIALFERYLLDAYQDGGTRVLATFRDLDDPERWVWIRCFPDAASRGPALSRFYGSAVWKREADATNATIADIAEAMLLTSPQAPLSDLPHAPLAGQGAQNPHVYVINVFPLLPAAERDFGAAFQRMVLPQLARAGAGPLLTLSTDIRENSFPRQPVRTAPVFVTLTRFSSLAERDAARERLTASSTRGELPRELRAMLSASVEVLNLAPTSRSALR